MEDLAGQRFGKLVAIQREGYYRTPSAKRNYGSRWLCRCDCGTEKTASSYALKAGSVGSCGCARSKPQKEGVARNKILTNYKGSARKRGLAWKLSNEEFDKITSMNCNYCGLPPGNIAKTGALYEGGDFIYSGINQVDNTCGYVLENVVPCCKTCNDAKKAMSLDKFLAWIARLTAYQSQFQGKKS